MQTRTRHTPAGQHTLTARIALLATLSFFTAGCELIGNIFQAGLVVGIIIVVLLIAVIGWIINRFRGRAPR